MEKRMSKILEGSPFAKKVIILILKIPKGKVATYGQISKLAGKPHGSRGVAWILHSCSTIYRLPWHRVLNSQGKISFAKSTHNFRKQRALLMEEGIAISTNGALDLSTFQWNKKAKKSRPKRGFPRMFAD